MSFDLVVKTREHRSAGKVYGTMLYVSSDYNVLRDPEPGQCCGLLTRNSRRFLIITLKVPKRYTESLTDLFASNLFGPVDWKTACWLGKVGKRGLRVYLPKSVPIQLRTPATYNAEVIRDERNLSRPAYALAVNLETPVENDDAPQTEN